MAEVSPVRLCSIGLRVASAQGLGFGVYNIYIYICSHDKVMVKWGETSVASCQFEHASASAQNAFISLHPANLV